MSIRQYISQWPWLLLSTLIVFSLSSCRTEKEVRGKQPDAPTAYMKFALRTNSNPNAQDESKILNLYVLVASVLDGSVVYKGNVNLSDNGTHMVSDAIKLPKGTYDFYFFANLGAMGTDVTNALGAMRHTSEFKSNAVFRKIRYPNNVVGIQPEGIAMSARYKRVAIPDEDYTKPNNPWHFNPEGHPTRKDYVIKMLRAYARVDLVFKNDPRLLTVPAPATPYKEITSIEVANIPQYYSVPPYDHDFLTTYTGVSDATFSLSWDKAKLTQKGFKYGTEEIGKLTFYIPEFIHYKAQDLNNAVKITIKGENGLNKTFKLTHERFDDYNQQGYRDLEHTLLSPNAILRNTHYTVEFTIRPDNSSQPGNKDVRINVKNWESVEFTPPPFASFLHVPDRVIFIGTEQEVEEDFYIPYYSSHPVGLGSMEDLARVPWIKELKLLNRNKQEVAGDTQGYIYVKVAKKWDTNQPRKITAPYNVELHNNHMVTSGSEIGALQLFVRLYLRAPQEGNVPFIPFEPPPEPEPPHKPEPPHEPGPIPKPQPKPIPEPPGEDGGGEIVVS